MLFQPNFWNSKNILSAFFLPLSYIYRFLSLITNFKQPKKVGIPVICVGNLTIGGTGKTPLVITLSKLLNNNGKRVAVLLRGYGGKLSGPLEVKNHHSTIEVGDEAKIHSNYNSTWISKNRYEGAKLIIKENKYDFIILDDGLQNRNLKQDLKISVFDSIKALGNERVFPAGPLRENLKFASNKIDYAIIVGEKNYKLEKTLNMNNPNLKITYASFEKDQKRLKLPISKNVIAFAGIGIPEKFFKFLSKIGLEPLDKICFSDHYNYKDSDIDKLAKIAIKKNAVLVTTSKDFIKISELESYKNYKEIVFDIPVLLKLKNSSHLTSLINKIL